MQPMRLYLEDLFYLAPELTLVVSAVLLAVLDLLLPNRVNRAPLAVISLLALAVSAAFVVYFMVDANADGAAGEVVQLLGNSYRVDDFANVFKLLMLAGTALIIFLSLGHVRRAEESGIRHIGEYYYLFLPAVLGGMIMASSGDLITLYVGLELLSITSYVMVALRKANQQSGEAAFKYMVNGSIASALILYGMSFVYGMTGSTNIGVVYRELSQFDPSFTALVYVSFFLMLGGFGVKIAAAPFHTWAPDVYQGAPTPVTAFLATVSKAAAFALVFRIVYNLYLIGNSDAPVFDDAFLAILIVAAASMIVGNALALRQRNMKRLLAYSGIANAGYLLVPIGIMFGDLNMHLSNFTEMMFYLTAYLFMNIGAFAVLIVVSRAAGHDEMKGFAGLYYRAPFTALAMTVLLLSLAGLPVTGGFVGKFYILLGAAQVRQYWLVAVMFLTSVASFYYYFSIIRQMYMRQAVDTGAVRLTVPLSVTIWICTVVTVLLGVFPGWVVRLMERVFSIQTDLFIF